MEMVMETCKFQCTFRRSLPCIDIIKINRCQFEKGPK